MQNAQTVIQDMDDLIESLHRLEISGGDVPDGLQSVAMVAYRENGITALVVADMNQNLYHIIRVEQPMNPEQAIDFAELLDFVKVRALEGTQSAIRRLMQQMNDNPK